MWLVNIKMTVPKWISLCIYVFIYLFLDSNHQTVDQKTDHNQCSLLHLLEPWAWENPQDRSCAACLCSLLAWVWTPRTCDFASENAIFQNQTLHSASDWRIFQGDKQWLWLAFAKAKASTCFSWKVPVPLCFCQSRMRLWGSSEQWTPKCFQACERREVTH